MFLCADDIEKQSLFSGAESMCNNQKRKKKVIHFFILNKLKKTLLLLYTLCKYHTFYYINLPILLFDKLTENN